MFKNVDLNTSINDSGSQGREIKEESRNQDFPVKSVGKTVSKKNVIIQKMQNPKISTKKQVDFFKNCKKMAFQLVTNIENHQKKAADVNTPRKSTKIKNFFQNKN